MTIKNRQITLAERPKGMPDEQTFQFKTEEINEIQQDEVLLRTLYVSVDPYMRGRMVDAEAYIEPFQLNEVIEGGSIGEVIESKSEHYTVGDSCNRKLWLARILWSLKRMKFVKLTHQ